MSQNYTITGIDRKLWSEFKSACAHYDISIRATLLKHIQNIVNDYRKYKAGYVDRGFRTPTRRKK